MTTSVPNIQSDVGRHIIEEYIDEYDACALDTMLRQAGAPCPNEKAEKRFRLVQLIHNLNDRATEAKKAVPVSSIYTITQNMRIDTCLTPCVAPH
jgi:hypothetical protein